MAGYNIFDMIPALGSFMEEQQERGQAPGRARALQRQETLMGSAPRAERSMTDQMGLTTTMQGSEGSGLMQDPEAFYNQQQYAMGLMGNKYTEDVGAQMMGSSFGDMMRGPARRADRQLRMDQWQGEQELRIRDSNRKQGRRIQGYQDMNQLASQETGLARDAQAILQPLRDGVQLYANVQNVVRDKGFTGMSVTDDTVMIKSLAKLMLPNEAVMEGDINALAMMEGLPAAIKSLARKAGMGQKLTIEERQQLYDQINRMGGQRTQEWQQTRDDFTNRAKSYGMTPSNVLRTGFDVDRTNYGQGQPPAMLRRQPGGGDGGGDLTGQALQDDLDRRFEESQGRDGGNTPGWIQDSFNWFEDFRR